MRNATALFRTLSGSPQKDVLSSELRPGLRDVAASQYGELVASEILAAPESEQSAMILELAMQAFRLAQQLTATRGEAAGEREFTDWLLAQFPEVARHFDDIEMHREMRRTAGRHHAEAEFEAQI